MFLEATEGRHFVDLVCQATVSCTWCGVSEGTVTDGRAARARYGSKVDEDFSFCLDSRLANGWISSDRYCDADALKLR